MQLHRCRSDVAKNRAQAHSSSGSLNQLLAVGPYWRGASSSGLLSRSEALDEILSLVNAPAHL